MSVEIRGLEGVKQLFVSLGRWANTGSRGNVGDGAVVIAKQLREAIARGQGSDGSPLAPLTKATLEGPVRRDGDTQIRGDVGAIPLSASGKTANSIKSKKVGLDEWEISADSDRGDMILYSNAKQVHNGSPFGGDTPKANRDPLQVSDKQMDLMEDELLKGIDKALNG